MGALVPVVERTSIKYTVCRRCSMNSTTASATRIRSPSGTVGHGVVLTKCSLLLRSIFCMCVSEQPRFLARNVSDAISRFKNEHTRPDVFRFFFRPRRFFHMLHVLLHCTHCRLLAPYLITFALQQEDFSCFLFIHENYLLKRQRLLVITM